MKTKRGTARTSRPHLWALCGARCLPPHNAKALTKTVEILSSAHDGRDAKSSTA